MVAKLDQPNVIQDCDNIVSTQKETSSLVVVKYGRLTKIWLPPFFIPPPATIFYPSSPILLKMVSRQIRFGLVADG
jgi:hypothetical protein